MSLTAEVFKSMEARLKYEQQAPVTDAHHDIAHDESGMQTFVEKSQKIQSIEKLPGDASTRRYYRVNAVDDGQKKSLIVMVMEPFEEKGLSIPFLAIQKHLTEAGVDVPQVIDCDPSQGFILLEDLGDVTLLRRLQDISNAEQERGYFEKAIDALVDMHVGSGPAKASADAKKSIDGFKLFFDREKLMWEVNFTFEHFYQKHLQRKIAPKDMKVLIDGFNRICTELQGEPTVFTHRDYHSRNLMVAPDASAAIKPGGLADRFVMIDFQDARMGPCQYDLASLLRDSYYQLSENQVQGLTAYYRDQMKDRGDKAVICDSTEKFERLFDIMAVQRNFKAIGSFASFLNRRGNPAYLKFIGNTFENIRRNLLKYPEFKELREVLYHYYYF